MCCIRVDMVALTGQVQGRVNGLWGMLECCELQTQSVLGLLGVNLGGRKAQV